ncbi:hypothetical protein Gasu2_34960 [Galdieria sulphuraria]|uniref:Uncharacterized protein n=1 Tax=Galdieria sulphuraria TaxID=130081 RepID=M2XBY5_GALSU|nr:uncharacterized protein Gasu_49950 [Galdieria sulphuraria]EME27397.1 hypothetical protein Gasu_49950 [Galdieria sulphuraria]GJD09234.1 hypothetical protein Gasu2_34960 [Galdieria sulphuraria]|eukprot:XP_005703917.1 hypothetical protein Gasu_49950 [Galdieria sulphuraria]
MILKKNYKFVNLYIYVDSKFDEEYQSQKELNNIIRVREATQGFQWLLGRKEIHYRTVHHGLQNQWLAAWYPTNEMEASIFLEDDIEISCRFLEYIEKILLAMESSRKNSESFGEFEQCGGIVMEELQISQHFLASNITQQFLNCFRVRFTSSWGPIYFGTFWKHFMDWYLTVTLRPNFTPYTETSDEKYNLWLRQGKDVWSPWLKRFLDETDYWFIYCKPPHKNTVWLHNHAEMGVNTHSYQRSSLPQLFSGDLSLFDIPCFKSSK